MPTTREFIAERKASKARASRPIGVEAGVTAVADSVGTKLGRGRLRSIAGSDRHHDAVRALARTALEYPTPEIPPASPHRLQRRAPRVGPARPLFQAERERLRMLLGRDPYSLTDDEVDIISRLAATTDPSNAERPQREEVAADRALVDTIFEPLRERFDAEHAVAEAEAQAAAGLTARPALPITDALAEAAAETYLDRNPDVSDSYALQEGRRELTASRDRVLRERRRQHREAVARLEEAQEAAAEHRRASRKTAMSNA